MFVDRNLILFVLLSGALHLISFPLQFAGSERQRVAQPVGIRYLTRTAASFQPLIPAEKATRAVPAAAPDSPVPAVHTQLQSDTANAKVPPANFGTERKHNTEPEDPNSRPVVHNLAPTRDAGTTENRPRKDPLEETRMEIRSQLTEPLEPAVISSTVAPDKAEETLQARQDGLSPVSKEETMPEEGRLTGTGKVAEKKQDIFLEARPHYAHNPAPVYPEIARRRGWQGTVQFEVLVLENGRVGELDMLSSSGFRSLDQAARKTIYRWTFQPATRAGLPVASRVVVPIDFILKEAD